MHVRFQADLTETVSSSKEVLFTEDRALDSNNSAMALREMKRIEAKRINIANGYTKCVKAMANNIKECKYNNKL